MQPADRPCENKESTTPCQSGLHTRAESPIRSYRVMAGLRCYTGVIEILHTLPTQKSLRVLGSSQGLMRAPMGVAHPARDHPVRIKRGARPADFLQIKSSDNGREILFV